MTNGPRVDGRYGASWLVVIAILCLRPTQVSGQSHSDVVISPRPSFLYRTQFNLQGWSGVERLAVGIDTTKVGRKSYGKEGLAIGLLAGTGLCLLDETRGGSCWHKIPLMGIAGYAFGRWLVPTRRE